MRKVEFKYVEVLNETEQLMLFSTVFGGTEYGATVTLNTALSIKNQDIEIGKVVYQLENMKRKDTLTAVDAVEDKE